MTKNKEFEPVSLARAETLVLKAPCSVPVRTSFGTMDYRSSVLIRVEDKDGAYGWGEVWCNFPRGAADHRARLITDTLLPLLATQPHIVASEVLPFLAQKTHILEIQCGEPGPVSQTIAGVDMAVWDLIARKKGKPLYTLFTDREVEKIPVYASGINPGQSLETIAESRRRGYRAFKLKVGFGNEMDLTNISRIFPQLGENEVLMLDANQAWSLEEAKDFVKKLLSFPIEWLEEPLPADRPKEEWAELSSSSPVPLAAGENIRGVKDFANIISDGHISIIQPDACKWGGVSGCLEVAQKAIEAGKRYCPHYLGGGVGLIASAHILAAVGGDGLLEVDVNPNPLREGLGMPFPEVRDGFLCMSDAPGLGVEPYFKMVQPYLVSRNEVRF
jgi:D-galactarolactone cycloisomerase